MASARRRLDLHQNLAARCGYGNVMGKFPACPNCARKMRPVPESELAGSGHDVYRCEPCGVMFTEAPDMRSPDTDRALDLNFGTNAVRH